MSMCDRCSEHRGNCQCYTYRVVLERGPEKDAVTYEHRNDSRGARRRADALCRLHGVRDYETSADGLTFTVNAGGYYHG